MPKEIITQNQAEDDSKFESVDPSDFSDDDDVSTVLQNNALNEESDFINEFINDDPNLTKPDNAPVQQQEQERKQFDANQHLPDDVRKRQEQAGVNDETNDQTDDVVDDDKSLMDDEADPDDNELDLNFDNDNFQEDEVRRMEQLNSELGTDYKSMNDLKNAIGQKPEIDEQANEIESYNQQLGQLDYGINKMSDFDLNLDKKIYEHQKNTGNKVTTENREIFREEINEMDPDVMAALAQNMRLEFKLKHNEVSGKLNAINTSIEKNKVEKERQQEEKIKEATVELHKKGDFYGLKLNNKEFVTAYNNVRNNSLIDKIKSDPKIALELELFLNNREAINKITSGPTYSDGVDATANAIAGKNVKPVRHVKNDANADDSHEDFLRRFLS